MKIWRVMVEKRIEASAAKAYIFSPFVVRTGRGSILPGGPDPIQEPMRYFVWLCGEGKGWCLDADEAMAVYVKSNRAEQDPLHQASHGVSVEPWSERGD